MSSLLQFNGEITREGVHIPVYLKPEAVGLKTFEHHFDLPQGDPGRCVYNMAEPVACSRCGKNHQQLYIIVRKPVGMCGCWVIFRINGKKEAHDLSCPVDLDRIPRGARKVTAEENEKIWHSE